MERTGVVSVRQVVNVGDTALDLESGWNAGVGGNVGVLSVETARGINCGRHLTRTCSPAWPTCRASGSPETNRPDGYASPRRLPAPASSPGSALRIEWPAGIGQPMQALWIRPPRSVGGAARETVHGLAIPDEEVLGLRTWVIRLTSGRKTRGTTARMDWTPRSRASNPSWLR